MSLFVAVESDFLLAHAMGERTAIAAFRLIKLARGHVVASPSVLQELAYAYRRMGSEALRGPPGVALRALRELGVLCPELSPKDHAIADATANKLIARGLCSTRQGALILSEAAILDCALLLTYRIYRYGENGMAMRLLFLESDLGDCIPLPPQWFINHFSVD